MNVENLEYDELYNKIYNKIKSEFDAKYSSLEKKFSVLKTENFELKKKCKLLEKENKELKSELKKTKSELNKYKNSDTPSSANKHLSGNNIKPTNKLKKRGAPKGHKGKTRTQIPTQKEIVDCKECPKCKSENTNTEKIYKRVVEDIPKIVKPITKVVYIHKKKCNNCGISFIPPKNTTPLTGKFGINIMVMTVFLKYILRGVLRKTQLFFNQDFMLNMTPATINSIINRVSDAANDEYEDIKKRMRKNKIIYVDETSFSVLGKKQWAWIFRTSNDILLVIRPSRGSNVLEEVLGKEYCGTIICDCWRAYNFLKNANLQRCWAHLLRKSKALSEFKGGKKLHNQLKKIFKEIKDFNLVEHSVFERETKYQELTDRLKIIVKNNIENKDLESVIKYINFNIENWMTCVKLEGIEPTNNFAEQSIRETVMVRKIIGAFRSEKGKKSYETLASLMATWQMQNLNMKEELKKILIKKLCIC